MSEAGPAALWERAPCGLLSTLANGTIVVVNHTLCGWLGHSVDDLVGRCRFQDLLTVGGRIFHQTHWMPLLQMQGSVAEVHLELVHRDGHTVSVLVNAAEARRDGVLHHDIAVFVATDRRKYERQLLDARRRAEELLDRERAAQQEIIALQQERAEQAGQRAALVEELIGIVSHDLRSPLNAITIGVSLLAEGTDLDPRTARVAQRMGAAASRASRLISELLDFTQARLGGGLRMAPTSIDLHALAAQAVEELNLAWPNRTVEHRAVGVGTGHGDPDRLAQVLTNLAGNALTYGAKDLPVVVTSTVGERELVLEVHNRGPAIPPALLPHLFEPYRRGDHMVNQSARSVGLGLYIVQQIAHGHGGSVVATSSDDDGTRFRVTLPR